MHSNEAFSYFDAMYFFDELPSTSSFLKELPADARSYCCMARSQSAGYGQRQRVWQSPLGNLALSLRFVLPWAPAALGGLTQAAALAVAQTLDPQAQHLRLKWPNDLLLARAGILYKLGGLLLETQSFNGGSLCVLGLGLNVAQAPEGAACWREIAAQAELWSVLKALLPACCAMIESFRHKPYLPCDHAWNDYDAFLGQKVRLSHATGAFLLQGIDQKGRLLAIHKGQLQFLTQTRLVGLC